MAAMTVLEFIRSRANIEKVEFEGGYALFYLTAYEDADGKVRYIAEYLQEFICDILGEGWHVLTERNSDGDEIAIGICRKVK